MLPFLSKHGVMDLLPVASCGIFLIKHLCQQMLFVYSFTMQQLLVPLNVSSGGIFRNVKGGVRCTYSKSIFTLSVVNLFSVVIHLFFVAFFHSAGSRGTRPP